MFDLELLPQEEDRLVAARLNDYIKQLNDIRVVGSRYESMIMGGLVGKALLLQLSIIERAYEISRSIAVCWNDKNFVSSAILARALIESASLLHYLAMKICSMESRNDYSNLAGEINNKIFFASRVDGFYGENKERYAIGILTLIDKLDKELSGIREVYDHLSDIAHPNYSGLIGHYVQLEEGGLYVGIKEDTRLFDLIDISISLLPTVTKWHNDILKKFMSVARKL